MSGKSIKLAILTHEEIAIRAREIWLAEGCPSGQDVEIWLKAEWDLDHTKCLAQQNTRQPEQKTKNKPGSTVRSRS